MVIQIPSKNFFQTEQYGVTATIPKTNFDGGSEYAGVRLRQGLWLEINLKNGDVYFTHRCLEGMRSATDPVVERFVNEYSDLLESMAEENGELLGFINPIISRLVLLVDCKQCNHCAGANRTRNLLQSV